MHNVLFVYTQQTPTESKAYVRDVVIEGITNVDAAGAVACTTCPTGMYANAADATCEEAQLGFYVPPSDAGLTAPLPCPVNTFADHTGSGACTPCGAGTTTSGQTGRSECDDPCRLVLADGDVFSLARLSTNGLMYTIPVPASVSGADDQEWHLEMCVASGDSSHCRNPDGSQMHTRACMEVDGEVFDAGRAVAYYPLPAPSVGVKVQLFHGGSCPTGGELMTEIDVHCDIEGGIGSPVPATPFQTGCLHKFSWRSGYGCPACLESDFEEVVGECKGGVQVWRLFLFFFLPFVTFVSCPMHAHLMLRFSVLTLLPSTPLLLAVLWPLDHVLDQEARLPGRASRRFQRPLLQRRSVVGLHRRCRRRAGPCRLRLPHVLLPRPQDRVQVQV